MRLVLIRHGETDYNCEKKYCGFSNPTLNKRGLWQAHKLFEKLKAITIEKVYASSLKRAMMTAKIIFPQQEIEAVEDLCEMNFGIFEGLAYDVIIKKHSQIYQSWINNPEKVKIPKGEGLIDLDKRVNETLSKIILQNQDKTIAAISHGGAIRTILCRVLKLPLRAFWQVKQDTAAVNIIDYTKQTEPVLILNNDVSHLAS